MQSVCLIMLIRPNEHSDFVYDILILNIIIIIIHAFINFVITYNRVKRSKKINELKRKSKTYYFTTKKEQ